MKKLSVMVEYFQSKTMVKLNGALLKREQVEGSYSSKFSVKTDDEGYLYISVNPTKFIQGHNVFGSNDHFMCHKDLLLVPD